MENQTMVGNFVLLGFTEVQNLKTLIFVILLLTYILTIMGNIVIITITLLDHRLQSPMYYFLWNFSLLEIGFTSTVIPKALFNLASGNRTISVAGCYVQAFLYIVLGTTEFFLLAVMSFDRCVAICYPLSYTTIMNEQVCELLVLASWFGGFFLVLGPLLALFQLPFCSQNIINHFFCDNAPLIKLACADTRLLELVDFTVAVISLLGTLTITILSYAKIICTILSFPSSLGRQKAFSTCISHLTVVSITYGSCIFMYIKPTRKSGVDLSKAVSILNTVVSPFLNPFIYSLRNKQVQIALRQTFRMRTMFSNVPKV
ncbi:olfactory receptor 6C74-like [Alligator mississippiensis]|uniref:olfactory receptor 6C74-like n=1 Tax=Alligator mississippiensis TaxID=8496 RepID=UPI0028777802|nr:olfactory receptor 6C74-like [Alligator mississippiensis]